jgi:uncharacterized protein
MAIDVAPRRAAPPRTSGSLRTAAQVGGAIALVAIAIRAVDPAGVAWLQNLLIVFGSLVVEATPFVVLGAFVSAAIEVLVPPRAFARIGRLPGPIQVPAAALAGVAFPVCECGSVPVARRLARRGLAPSAAVTFMLAAPILNPVVVASTFVAYRGRDALWVMVGGRVALGALAAIAVGWVVGAMGTGRLLRDRSDAEVEEVAADESRRRRFVGHVAGDVVFMMRFLVLGAAIAAALQTFVPQTFVTRLADLPVLSLVAMMGLAFLMSLCSESDAFVAASFVGFGPSAQLAFLVFGPMLDLKLTALYAGTFRRGFVPAVAITVFAVTLVGTMWLQVVFG